jgi:hypothetical protein
MAGIQSPCTLSVFHNFGFLKSGSFLGLEHSGFFNRLSPSLCFLVVYGRADQLHVAVTFRDPPTTAARLRFIIIVTGNIRYNRSICTRSFGVIHDKGTISVSYGTSWSGTVGCPSCILMSGMIRWGERTTMVWALRLNSLIFVLIDLA